MDRLPSGNSIRRAVQALAISILRLEARRVNGMKGMAKGSKVEEEEEEEEEETAWGKKCVDGVGSWGAQRALLIVESWCFEESVRKE
jgi:hypothetical protein